jgi:hypothetical protein
MVEASTKARAANKLARFWRLYRMLALGHLIVNFADIGLLEVDIKRIRCFILFSYYVYFMFFIHACLF